MNGTERKIEIIKPLEDAFALMKKILFQPFDLTKWLVIGFASFLAGHFAAGGGIHFPFGNFPPRHGNQNFNPPNLEQFKPWLALGIALFVLFILVFVIVFMWLRSRGTFIFTDCIVKNRAAISEPWREYRKEGNSYFLFGIVVMFSAMAIFLVLGGGGVLLFVSVGHAAHNSAFPIVAAIFGGLLLLAWLCFAICFGVVSYFMPFVMYVRRCKALEAFRIAGRLILNNAEPFILFCLFGIVLIVGGVFVGGIVTCATCCIAALPYVGTVILLPVFVLFRAYGLLFLRQFGPDYDVWAGSSPILPAAISTEPPPLPPPPPIQE